MSPHTDLATQFFWDPDMPTGLNVLAKIDEIDKSILSIQPSKSQKTRFQRFLRGKSVLFKWKC